jgi:CRISPR type III-B/RAMP module-associated protein Cmr5
MKTLEQKRASSALDAVEAMQKHGRCGDIRIRLESLPALIATNGLLATALSLQPDDPQKDSAAADRQVFRALEKWLTGGDSPIVWQAQEKPTDLGQRLVRESSSTYLLATEEALAYAVWLKHWAQALIEKRKPGDKEAGHAG